MQQSRFFMFIGFCIAAVVTLWLSVFIVYPRQQVAVKRFGQIVRVEPQPGLYFKLPFVDQTVIVDDRLRRYDLPTKTVQVRGGRFYEVDAFFIYRITDARAFLQKVKSGRPAVAEVANLAPRFDDALQAVYGLRAFNAALSSERNDMMREVQEQVVKDANELGITIVDARIRKTDLTQEASASTFDRMKQERSAVAEQLRANGRLEKERIIARADREAEEIVAVASRDSKILRGEGDAEKMRIIREAMSSDPEFYNFWRSMEAYKKMKDVPMVLTPDAPFFRYLFQPQTAAGGR